MMRTVMGTHNTKILLVSERRKQQHESKMTIVIMILMMKMIATIVVTLIMTVVMKTIEHETNNSKCHDNKSPCQAGVNVPPAG